MAAVQALLLIQNGFLQMELLPVAPEAEPNLALTRGAGGSYRRRSACGSRECYSPGRRFGPARSQMGSYLGNGSRDDLRGATRSMVSKGMGGASRAASTMRSTARGAGALGQFLMAARDGTDQRVTDWVARCRSANLSASDLALEVLKEVFPDRAALTKTRCVMPAQRR